MIEYVVLGLIFVVLVGNHIMQRTVGSLITMLVITSFYTLYILTNRFGPCTTEMFSIAEIVMLGGYVVMFGILLKFPPGSPAVLPKVNKGNSKARSDDNDNEDSALLGLDDIIKNGSKEDADDLFSVL